MRNKKLLELLNKNPNLETVMTGIKKDLEIQKQRLLKAKKIARYIVEAYLVISWVVQTIGGLL